MLLGATQQHHCRWPWTCLIFQRVSDFNYFILLYAACSGLLYTHSRRETHTAGKRWRDQGALMEPLVMVVRTLVFYDFVRVCEYVCVCVFARGPPLECESVLQVGCDRKNMNPGKKGGKNKQNVWHTRGFREGIIGAVFQKQLRHFIPVNKIVMSALILSRLTYQAL